MLIENGYVSKYGDVEPVRVYIQKNKKEVLWEIWIVHD